MDPREEIINEIVEKGVFEAIGDGVSIQNTNFKILYQNNVHKKIIGNHVGEYCYNAYEKRKSRCEGCPLAATFKDGGIHTRERSAPTEKGTIYVEITSSPIKVPSGEIIAGIEVVRDITERKQIAEAIRASEKKFRNLAENLTELVYRAAPDTCRATYVNKSVEDIYGYTAEEWLHKPELWEKTIHPDDKERVYAKIEEAQKRYEPFIIEYRIVRKDAGIRWVKDHISWERDNDENVISLNGILYDITEIKVAEKKIRDISNRNKAIISAIPDIIMEVDSNKVYTWANNAGYNFFGNDVIGKKAEYYFEGAQETYDIVQPLFEGDENTVYVESWQRRKDGEKRLLAWWCRVLKDEDGKVTGALSSARDITEQKRADEELRRRVEELEEFYQTSINRELKMKQLKEENEKLMAKLLKDKK